MEKCYSLDLVGEKERISVDAIIRHIENTNKVKIKFHKRVIILIMIYGMYFLPFKGKNVHNLKTLRWVCSYTNLDRIRKK